MTVPDHPVVIAVSPVLAAVGAELIPPDAMTASDIPLAWEGETVAGVRLGELYGALDRMIAAVEADLGSPLRELPREGKQAAVRTLDARGAFLLRKSIEDVAEAMGVSRITIYNYLNAIRGS